MNRTVRALATILTTLVACVGVFLAGAPAKASPRAAFAPTTARVAGELCHDRGTTNYYVHHWSPVPVWKIVNSPFVFGEHRCRTGALRLYKSTANTAHEARFARRFLKQALHAPKGDPNPQEQPTIFCRTSKTSAYFLDLGFYWGMASAKHMNAAERHQYTPWAHRYADRHGCHLFEPKS